MSKFLDTLGSIAGAASNFSSITGAISGGFGLLKGLFGDDGMSQERKRMEMQNQYSKDLLDYQFGQAQDMTKFQNEQSLLLNQQMPAAQKAGMINAGINPAVMAGGVSPSQSSSPSQGSAVPAGNLLDAMFKKRELDLQAALIGAQVENIHADTQNKKSETNVNDINAQYLPAILSSGINESAARQILLEAQKQGLDLANGLTRGQWTELLKRAGLDNAQIEATIDNLNKNSLLTQEKTTTEQVLREPTKENIEANTANLGAQKDAVLAGVQQKWVELKLKERELSIEQQKVEVSKILAESQVALNELVGKYHNALTEKTERERVKLLSDMMVNFANIAKTKSETAAIEFANKQMKSWGIDGVKDREQSQRILNYCLSYMSVMNGTASMINSVVNGVQTVDGMGNTPALIKGFGQ